MTQYAGSESDFLKAADLGGKSIKVTIEKVALVHFDNKDDEGKTVKDTKPCLSLVGKEKKIVCNPTTVMTLGNAYGFDSDAWVGKEIGLSTKYYDAPINKEGIVITAMDSFEDDADIPFQP